MNRYLCALAFSLFASAALAQFADGPPAAARGGRGADERNAAKAGAPADRRGAAADAFGAADPNAAAAPNAAPAVNRMFEAIDTNGDGVISKAELAKAATSLKKLDLDGDGNITLAEATGPTGPVGAAANVNQMVDQFMQQYDKNHDNKLTADEVPPEMAMSLRTADQNGDSVISRPELAAAMEKMQNIFMGQGGGFRGGMNQGGNSAMQQMMQWDTNHDGKLSPDEVPPQMKAMLQGADLNRDGFIDAQEMQAFMAVMGQRMGRGGFQPMGGGVKRGGY